MGTTGFYPVGFAINLAIGWFFLSFLQSAFGSLVAGKGEALLSRFQAIAFKLADMAMKIEHARIFLYKACWLRDQKKPFGKESAMAKLYCSEVAQWVANEAVQIHGGYGLMKEFDVERFYRDQRLLQIGEGTSEIQRLVIARQLLGK